jgi:hypothetical protein
MLTDRDWVMRAVKQLADVIARALKLTREDKHRPAIELLQGACVELFGIEYRVLSMVDAATAVELLGDAPRGLAFASLVRAMWQTEPDPLRKEARRAQLDELAGALARRFPANAEVAALAAGAQEPSAA